MSQLWERLVLIAISILAIAVSLAEIFGVLENLTWVEERIPLITLVFLGIAIPYLVLRTSPIPPTIEEITDSFDSRIEGLHSELRSTREFQIQTFNKLEDFYYYIADKLNGATNKVDDITWGSLTAYKTEAQEDAYGAYVTAMHTACQKRTIEYREISSLSDQHYFNRAIEMIQKGYQSYDLGYFDIAKVPFPLLSFMTIDSRELLGWFYLDRSGINYAREVYVAINDPVIVKVFEGYFESLWNPTHKIKVGSTIDQGLLASVAKTLEVEMPNLLLPQR